ncbi:hypothetical protein BJ742DRAFT_811738 [Cladochytrium replicatum]|nr:hypothetical protein BJ742DRAFT_811738 [Cladochytrium replicatum]
MMLQRIPLEVQADILAYLPGSSVLRVSATSTSMNHLLSVANSSSISRKIWRSATISSFPESRFITEFLVLSPVESTDGESTESDEDCNKVAEVLSDFNSRLFHSDEREHFFTLGQSQYRRRQRSKVTDWELFHFVDPEHAEKNPWRTLWTILEFYAQPTKNKLKKFFQSRHADDTVTLGRYVTALKRIDAQSVNSNTHGSSPWWRSFTHDSDPYQSTNAYLNSMHFYNLIEYSASLEWSAETYRWDLIYVVFTRITIIGRNGVSAVFSFMGESAHCAWRCENRFLLNVEFLETASALKESCAFGQISVNTIEVLSLGDQKLLDLSYSSMKWIIGVLGLGEVGVTPQMLRTFLNDALVPKGDFVADTICEFTNEKANFGSVYSRAHWG